MPSIATRRSPSPAVHPAKRQKISDGTSIPVEHSATSVDTPTSTEKSKLNYRNGVVLAPMVRSGTLPSRLLALKYGADLVWGPEIVDRGMIGCSRVVDDATGVITYEKAGKPIWSTHPIEKPYLIYQVGSANPDLAAQSAMIVAQDVSGVELNCGCPKPFSTHAGMGANLLSTPDLLCDILVKLRSSLPQSIAVSAKIRMLPSQEDTLALVRRIVSTGISCLTVHCRTKEMRKRESALIHRLREIVECVEEMGLGIPVIANGDCLSRDDAVRLRDVTGAHSVMIATAAEKNLSCFAPGPLVDAESVLAPAYISLARYINNPWGNSKHCLSQFSSPGTSNDSIVGRKASLRDFKQRLAQAKGYEAFDDISTRGADILTEVERALADRPDAPLTAPADFGSLLVAEGGRDQRAAPKEEEEEQVVLAAATGTVHHEVPTSDTDAVPPSDSESLGQQHLPQTSVPIDSRVLLPV